MPLASSCGQVFAPYLLVGDGGENKLMFEPDRESESEADAAGCSAVFGSSRGGERTSFEVRVTAAAGGAAPLVTLGFDIAPWTRDAYVTLPGAVYAGNRFDVLDVPYPPMFAGEHNLGPDTPPVVTDIPRLAPESPLSQLSRDLATPAVALYLPAIGRGLIVLTDERTAAGDTGFDLREEAGDKLVLMVRAPGSRPDGFYDPPWRREHPRLRPAVRPAEVSLRAEVIEFECDSRMALLRRLFRERQSLRDGDASEHGVPFSHAARLVIEKYDRENWIKEDGVYAHRGDDGTWAWQSGWVGGTVPLLPLLALGDERTTSRTRRAADFAVTRGRSASGLFHGGVSAGGVVDDGFEKPQARDWTLVRKSADALYFMARMAAHVHEAGQPAPGPWLDAIRGCADAFCRLWDDEKQFGQFVNTRTGTIAVGGSASGALVPAGLALAAQLLGEPRYRTAAEASAEAMHARLVRDGFTTGGPGEALQAPDSESGFALLESFMVLHESAADDDVSWLGRAEDAAAYCATWVVSYDYPFPPRSLLGRWGVRSTGAVWANAQNKHAAPGICTLSGSSLFRLYRATGDAAYARLMREIAHNLTQYVSRPDRPLRSKDGRLAPPGWMNERVNLSDWMEPSGEVFHGSCWCEICAMLTWLDVPGVYLHTDTGAFQAFDHVEVTDVRPGGDAAGLTLRNPCPFDAEVTVLAEASADARISRSANLWSTMTRIVVPAGRTVTVEVMAAPLPPR